MMIDTCARLAGGDTTAISLRATIYFLIKNPHSYRKVIAEIDTANANGQLSKFITYSESVELTYLLVHPVTTLQENNPYFRRGCN